MGLERRLRHALETLDDGGMEKRAATMFWSLYEVTDEVRFDDMSLPDILAVNA